MAKPLYEQYIQLILAKGGTLDDDTKGKMAEAYAYLGSIAQYKEKDDAKTLDMYTKAKDMDPTNPQAVYYFATKGKAKAK